MKRVLGNVVAAVEGGIDGEYVRAALEAMDGPMSEAKSQAMFEAVMVKLDRQAARDASIARMAHMASAVVAALTGAGAYRLLTR